MSDPPPAGDGHERTRSARADQNPTLVQLGCLGFAIEPVLWLTFALVAALGFRAQWAAAISLTAIALLGGYVFRRWRQARH